MEATISTVSTSTITGLKNVDEIFALGKLYYERVDFDEAIVQLSRAADLYFQQRNLNKYLACQNILLRIFSERQESENINLTKEKLQDLVLKEGFELNAKTYYTLANCAFDKGQLDNALSYGQKSLALALAADNKEDICYAICAVAIVYFYQGRLEDSLKEIYNLEVFFQVMDLPDIKLTAKIINASILRELKKYEEAIEVLWQCYELLKKNNNMYMYLYLMYIMGITYKDMGELPMARMYLQLAKRSVDGKNLKDLAMRIDKNLSELGIHNQGDYDLIFSASTNSIIEKKKGKVDFKNQFILLDLLRMFIKNPGSVHSKESLVQTIWKQDYDPSVHDNKIYVTIKRLRQMIEPDFDKPKYIFRAKNGYYMNKNTKVLLDN